MPLCTLCQLHTRAKSVNIIYRGKGSRPKILFVGIAPGPNEDDQNKNFVGASGELLRTIMAELGIPESEIGYDNIVHCFPGYSREHEILNPDKHEILTCSPYLYRTIGLIDPDVIVTLGLLPWQELTGRPDTVVADFRGQVEMVFISGKMRKVIGSYHPSSAVRRSKDRKFNGHNTYRDMLKKDIQYAWDHANGLYYTPQYEIINDTQRAVEYIEETVRLYRAREIDFAAFDTETPQLILKTLKDRRKLGIELVSSDIWQAAKRFVGFALSYYRKSYKSPREVKGVFIPMDHPESKVDYLAVLNVLVWAIDRDGEVALPCVLHNHKYDAEWTMEKCGIAPINFFDTMLGSYIYYGSSQEHGLGATAHRVAKIDIFKDETEEYLDRLPMEQRSFRNLPLELLGRRGAIDAASTAILVISEHQMLEATGQLPITKLMNEFSELCAEMEWRGAAIDYEMQQRCITEYPKLMDEVAQRLMSLPTVQAYINDRTSGGTKKKDGTIRPPTPGYIINFNSWEVKWELIYEYYNLPRDLGDVPEEEDRGWSNDDDDTDTSEDSRHPMTLHCRDTKYDGTCSCRCHVPGWEGFHPVVAVKKVNKVLQQMNVFQRTFELHTPNNYLHYGIDPHSECYAFLIDLRLWSKLRKLWNDYLVKIERYFRPEEWNKRHQIDPSLRVVSFNYTLHYTKTGRLSTRDFPIHTEPWHSDARRLHVSRYKPWGGLMLSADYSQLEVRIVAAIARDEKLIEIYRQKQDVHKRTAGGIYQVSLDQVTEEMRRFAKTITFSIIYGGGEDAISEATGLPRREAKRLLEGFYSTYEGVARNVENCHRFVRQNGFVTTMMNRKFYLPGIFSENRKDVSAALRASQNYTVQSPASDITITAAVLLWRWLRQNKMYSYIWALVHDAIENDIYPGELLPYYLTLKQAMEETVVQIYPWIVVPLEAEFELGVRWDSSLKIKSLDTEKMVLKGKRGYFEETMETLARYYRFGCKVAKETYSGIHRGCGGDIDFATKKCSKCSAITQGYPDVDIGETLVKKRTYDGTPGGITDVTVEIEWKQDMLKRDLVVAA